MTRYTATAIDEALASSRPAFIGYLSTGFPSVQGSIDAAKTLVDNGADIIELGLPYTDPTMDGKVIQQAGQAALERGLRTRDVFTAVEQVAGTGAAVVIMTYYNLVFKYGEENFARDMANAGGAGLIIPDLIPEEAGPWAAAADAHHLDKIFLVAPSSTDERLRITAEASRGFVYAASRMGVTGLQTAISSSARSLVERTRAAGAPRVAVGIGVSNRDQAQEVGSYADGVIVGSAFVKPLVENDTNRAAGLIELAKVAADIGDGIYTARRN
ncbi:MAG: tryptophan synthase subunit alpha [Actinomycetaceae bacterium]|nr:tryptophan synthase subunit alpha [Actinomycetaceae bacterium]